MYFSSKAAKIVSCLFIQRAAKLGIIGSWQHIISYKTEAAACRGPEVLFSPQQSPGPSEKPLDEIQRHCQWKRFYENVGSTYDL